MADEFDQDVDQSVDPGGDAPETVQPQEDTVPRAALDKVLAQRKKALEREVAALARAEAAEAQLVQKAPRAEKSPSEASLAGYATVDDLDVAALQAKGYGDDEIAHAQTFAKGAGKRLKDVVGEPGVAYAIQGMRAAKKTTEATPPPSERVATQQGGIETAAYSSVPKAEADLRSKHLDALERVKKERAGRSFA